MGQHMFPKGCRFPWGSGPLGGSGKSAAERIEMPFRGLTRMSSRNNVLVACGACATWWIQLILRLYQLRQQRAKFRQRVCLQCNSAYAVICYWIECHIKFSPQNSPCDTVFRQNSLTLVTELHQLLMWKLKVSKFRCLSRATVTSVFSRKRTSAWNFDKFSGPILV